MGGGTRRVVDPARLGEAARRQLTDELYALNERIFEGVSRDRFVHHVIAPPARRTRILLRRNARGELIGYCAAHLFALSVSGGRHLVFRAEAGMLATYRGSGGTFLFGLRQALACRLHHPCTPLFLFCTLIHPSSYLLMSVRDLAWRGASGRRGRAPCPPRVDGRTHTPRMMRARSSPGPRS